MVKISQKGRTNFCPNPSPISRPSPQRQAALGLASEPFRLVLPHSVYFPELQAKEPGHIPPLTLSKGWMRTDTSSRASFPVQMGTLRCLAVGSWGTGDMHGSNHLTYYVLETLLTGVTKCQPCLFRDLTNSTGEATIQAERMEKKRDNRTELQRLCLEFSWEDSLGSWSTGPG